MRKIRVASFANGALQFHLGDSRRNDTIHFHASKYISTNAGINLGATVRIGGYLDRDDQEYAIAIKADFDADGNINNLNGSVKAIIGNMRENIVSYFDGDTEEAWLCGVNASSLPSHQCVEHDGWSIYVDAKIPLIKFTDLSIMEDTKVGVPE